MKRFVKAFVALCLTLSCVFGVVSCAEYEGNSKIKRVTITLNVNGESQDFNFKLHLNYAPGTIEHFTDLAKGKYYDGTAITNLDGHVEFGAYYYDANGELASKYGPSSDTIMYNSIITEAYKNGKYIGPNQNADSLRYDENSFVQGEFYENGYHGNELGLDGALILKRDIFNDEHERSPEAYNTARATMAICFSGDGYFTSSKEFAIIGMICSDDATGAVKSSKDRLKTLMSEYKEDDNDNVYYHYTYKTGERTDSYGDFFMYSAEEKAYFAKDDNGEFTIKIERNNDNTDAPENVLLDEFGEYDEYFNVLPAGVKITVEKITFAK